ncbi:undecaprenyl-phosphate glucose phosphotransferase [Lysobacter arvi]|uniref:Undecaprenyl-phosphate glucose phosphotransferase n=1 Tax=Lysobacter arvi TaxID=3038776 RepID=A0ABU1C987_9GAMM|nr:undecaprenyl-phosphate glucose phosphotransferase [Lysobacter arvi]MDR0181660.1 undecaprenyl-phosphate glucose phosphotransferase [Lysobacter arvi]
MLPIPIRRPYEVERLPQTRLTALLSLLLRASDLLVLAVAAIVAHKLRFGGASMSIEFERAIARALLFTLVILGPSSTYRGWRAKDWPRHMLRLFVLWTAVFIAGVLYVAVLKVPGVTSRLWWGYWFVGAVAGSCALRLVCLCVNRWAHAHGHEVFRAVIVGRPETASRIAIGLRSTLAAETTLLGWFSVDENAAPSMSGLQHLGSVNALRHYVESQGVRQVWLSPGEADSHWTTQVLDALKHSTADIKYVPSLAGDAIFSGSVETLSGMPVINLRSSPLDGEAQVIKGIEDRVLALLILVLILPVMAVIAVGVKLSSPGPVLFRQKRHGLDCMPIEVWKFRSMRVHQETAGAVTQATRHDSRVTRFGRFLRRTSLDELPQFFNVLQGTMSIVGPRPHAIAHNDYYKSVVQNYMQRHRMKPGITGWAQVNGLRGETDTVEKMAKRVEYDLYYMQNWSVLFDLRIIGMTLVKGFLSKAAY